MKFYFNTSVVLLLLFIGAWVKAYREHAAYCKDLKQKQYDKREAVLVAARDRCEESGTPVCLSEVQRLQQHLIHFDEQVLLHEHCSLQ